MDQASRLIHLASCKHVTICSCESFTAGLFCSTLGSVPGASVVLKGGLVTYQSEMKTRLAQVPASGIKEHGVVSAWCAAQMAANTLQIMEADYCVSFTGNAGPSAMEGKPAGLVYMAIARYCDPSRQAVEVCTLQALIKEARNPLRAKAVEFMIGTLVDILEEKERPDLHFVLQEAAAVLK